MDTQPNIAQVEGASPGLGQAPENRGVGGTPRRSLTAKLQQLLSPIKRPSLRHGGSGGTTTAAVEHARSSSEQRELRRSPLETHLLLPRERPGSTASEVGRLKWGRTAIPRGSPAVLLWEITTSSSSFHPQSSVSLASECDLSDTSVCSFSLRKSSDRLSEPPAVEVLLVAAPHLVKKACDMSSNLCSVKKCTKCDHQSQSPNLIFLKGLV